MGIEQRDGIYSISLVEQGKWCRTDLPWFVVLFSDADCRTLSIF